MNIKDLSLPLHVSQIDFRVQSVNNGGYATILAYKDARVDQQRLDDVVGPLNWKREHKDGNHNCIVSIWCDEKKQWVSKEDTGTESRTEAEKGLASDSFKRACFNWGIGRELYDYPNISIKLQDHEWEKVGDKAKATWRLQIRQWKWKTEFSGHKIVYLSAHDGKSLRFEWRSPDNPKKRIDKKAMQRTMEVIVSLLETDDDLGIKEAVEELTHDEQQFIWGLFTTKQKDKIRTCLNPPGDRDNGKRSK